MRAVFLVLVFIVDLNFFSLINTKFVYCFKKSYFVKKNKSYLKKILTCFLSFLLINTHSND